MLETIKEYSTICDKLYQDVEQGQNIENWTVSSTKKENISGFYSAILRKDDKYLIVYRGTNDLMDWVANTTIGFTIRSRQFRLAEEVYKTLLKQCPDKGKITLLGHSLGGGLAEFIGANYEIRTYTFNGIGIRHYLKPKISNQTDFSYINNYISVVDLVGNLLPHTTTKSYYVYQPENIIHDTEALRQIKDKINLMRKLATTIVFASSYFAHKIASIYNSAKDAANKCSIALLLKLLEIAGVKETFITLTKQQLVRPIVPVETAEKEWYRFAHGLQFFIEARESDIKYLGENNVLS